MNEEWIREATGEPCCDGDMPQRRPPAAGRSHGGTCACPLVWKHRQQSTNYIATQISTPINDF